MSCIYIDYFIESIKENNIIVASQLLKSNLTHDIDKAMLIACSYGYCEILQLLIRNGGNINMKEGHLMTLAIISKHSNIVELLFKNGFIIRKYHLFFSTVFSSLKMFRTIIQFINVEEHLDIIISLSVDKNNYRMLSEIINRKYNYTQYKNHSAIIRATLYNDILYYIYNKLLYRINNSTYNTINNNIISFIF